MKLNAMSEAASETASLVGLISKAYKYTKDEFYDWFQIGISDYIKDCKKNFSETTTYSSRFVKVPFYDVFFPIDLSTVDKTYSSIKIQDIIEKRNENCTCIIGIAGCGKTMLLRHAFLNTCNTQNYIPIYIELRSLNSLKISLIEYIYKIILKNKIKGNENILERTLESGLYTFFFDGYDEVSLELKDKVTLEIEELVTTYRNNRYVLTSRPLVNAEKLAKFKIFNVNKLTESQIEIFIEKQIGNKDPYLFEKLKSTIKANQEDYIEYLTNPLLLSMFILTYSFYPDVPKHKYKFYWNVFDTLTIKHDSINKLGGYIHDRKTKLQTEDFNTILQWFSFRTVLDEQYVFDNYELTRLLSRILKELNYKDVEINDLVFDLTVSISIIIQEGLEYKFPHRTLQDYFFVSFIKELSDEEKSIIYKEKFPNSSQLTNRNIFDLMLEMDKKSYTKMFLIPHLKKFFSNVHERNIKETICSKYSAFDIGLRLFSKGSICHLTLTLKIVHNEDIFSSLISDFFEFIVAREATFNDLKIANDKLDNIFTSSNFNILENKTILDIVDFKSIPLSTQIKVIDLLFSNSDYHYAEMELLKIKNFEYNTIEEQKESTINRRKFLHSKDFN